MRPRPFQFLIVILFFCGCTTLHAQWPEDISIGLKDRHNASVTHIEFSADGKFFCTGDLNGKIIMWNTDDLSFRKTLSPARDYRPLRGFQLFNLDSILFVTEGYQGRSADRDRRSISFGMDGDSIAFYHHHFGNTNKVKFSGDFLNSQHKQFALIGELHDGVNPIYRMQRNGGVEPEYLFTAEQAIACASLSPEGDLLAVAEFPEFSLWSEPANKLTFKDINHDSILWSGDVPGQVLHVHFEGSTALLIIYHGPSERISVVQHFLNNQSSTELASFDYTGLAPSFIKVNGADPFRMILLNQFSKPMILTRENGDVKEIYPKFEPGFITAASFIPDTDLVVYFRGGNDRSGTSVPDLFLHDLLTDTAIGSSINEFHHPSIAHYTDHDDLIIQRDWRIRNYERGTLSDVYNPLRFEDYLTSAHGISALYYNLPVWSEDRSKLVLSLNKDLGETGWPFAVYDLIQDKVDRNFRKDHDYIRPISYNSSKKCILARTFPDVNGVSSFAMIDDRKVKPIEGRNLACQLSNDGKTAMTIGEDRILRIYDLSRGRVIFEREMQGGAFRSGTAADAFFWVLQENVSTESGTRPITLLLEVADGKVELKEMPGVAVTGVHSGSGQTIFFVEGLGFILDSDQRVLCPGSEFPVHASFNKAGDRVMVSFNNGAIKVYETNPLKLIGTMVFPDDQAHLLLHADGHFLTNADPSAHLVAYRTGFPLELESLEQIYNRPERALSILGEVDTAYRKLLVRSMDIISKKRISPTKWVDEHTVSGPKIRTLRLQGSKNPLIARTLGQDLEVEVIAGANPIVGWSIVLNGFEVVKGPLSRNIDPRTSGRIRETLRLLPGHNNLEVMVQDGNGQWSEVRRHRIHCTAKEKAGNLYLITVGVSEYQRREMDLTYADKDALDLILLYGDSTHLDYKAYLDRFQGRRYSRRGEGGIDLPGEIRFYEGSYNSTLELVRLDRAGNHWLQSTYDGRYLLWDFRNSEIEEITLPKDVAKGWISGSPPEVQAAAEEGYFYCHDESGQHFRFDLAQRQYKRTSLPFTTRSFPLQREGWATIEYKDKDFIDDKPMEVRFRQARKENDEWNFKEWRTTFEETYLSPELLAVSPDGGKWMIVLGSELWVILLEQDKVRKRKLDSFDESESASLMEHAFSNDGKRFLSLSSYWDDATSGLVWVVHDRGLEDGKKKVREIRSDREARTGMNLLGGELNWVAISDPIAKNLDFLHPEPERRSAMRPVSFSNVFTLHLTNAEATRSQILAQVREFVGKVDARDQVIWFLAGHGILDDSLNYFFAPHDMEFDHPHIKGIPYSELVGIMESARSERKLLILDTCHSGDVLADQEDREQNAGARGDKDAEGRGLKVISSKRSRFRSIAEMLGLLFNNADSRNGITVMAATSGTAVALESREISNGALTAALIETVENTFVRDGFSYAKEEGRAGNLDPDILYGVQRNVYFKTQGRQITNLRQRSGIGNLRLW